MARNNARFVSRSAQAAMRLLLTLIVALAVSALAAPPAAASGPAPDTSTAKFEIDFMQDMIDHHAMAVEMAEICLEKVVHEELRQLCENIITTQTQEIELLQTWLTDWYGITHEPEMRPGDMRMIEKLASLSGSEFEIAFMEMMIKHHTKAVREAEKCLDRAYHSALLNLCQNIIATQSAEIEEMQTWLCEWYAICKER